MEEQEASATTRQASVRETSPSAATQAKEETEEAQPVLEASVASLSRQCVPLYALGRPQARREETAGQDVRQVTLQRPYHPLFQHQPMDHHGVRLLPADVPSPVSASASNASKE